MGRDYDLEVEKHEVIGEVFIVAAVFPSTLIQNTKESLLQRGEKWANWRRGRVVHYCSQVKFIRFFWCCSFVSTTVTFETFFL
jgi:hypothetical protein